MSSIVYPDTKREETYDEYHGEKVSIDAFSHIYSVFHLFPCPLTVESVLISATRTLTRIPQHYTYSHILGT